jgi:hypothetical protein
MRLSKQHLIALLVLVFMAVFGVMIAQKQGSSKGNAVEDFMVEDIPNDDGSGLMLSWKPLHRSKRIIEYRVYRGIDPDTLFFLAAVQVNVKTGVASDKMFFYDSGGSDFIDITSPGRLRKEKQQDAKSPLYRGIPRDMEIAARLSEKFDVMSYVDRRQFYYHSHQATSADAEDSTRYAGFKFKQQTLVAGLKKDETYYYSVVAVNERNQYQQYAKPVSGKPVANPPEPASALYCTYLEDKKELRFEWQYPLYKDDIAMYAIYKVEGVVDSLWARLKTLPDTTETYRKKIAQGGVNAGMLKNYKTLPVPDLDPEQVRNMRFAIELIDDEGSALSDLVAPRFALSSQLPDIARFRTEDKPNDKGDRLSLVWDHPIVFVTKTSSLNKNNTRLKINYQLNKAETQKVDNIYFEFSLPGEKKPFTKINEFYQDNSIILKVPQGYDYKQGFRVKISLAGRDVTVSYTKQIVGKDTLYVRKDTTHEDASLKDYYLEQDLIWDSSMMALMPGKELWRNGIEVSRLQNVVYRIGIRSQTPLLVKRNTSYDNNLDVTLAYPTIIPKPVVAFNFVKGNTLHTYAGGKRYSRPLRKGEPRSGLALVPADIDLAYDKENESTVITSIYKTEALKEIGQMRKDVQTTKATLDSLTALTDTTGVAKKLAQTNSKLENQQKRLDMMLNNPQMQKSLEFKNDRARMRYIASIREPETRHHSYQIVKTDGQGLYTESDPDTLPNGEINYMMPISNWFISDKWVTLVAVLLFGLTVVIFVRLARRGKDLYIRPIPGLHEIPNAVGRATEMGRPMMYMMGSGGLSDVATLASLGILGLVAKQAAEYDTKLIVPCYDYIVMPVAQEIVREAHYSVGRPDTYDKNNVFYLTNSQFAYVAGVNGIMIRERVATNFFLGYFYAESLLMTETGNTVGAVQIAGCDSTTQIPFFITTCDYTLIGEELYAASAYLNREPMLLGTLKAQDYFKFLIVVLIAVGAILSSFQAMGLMNIFPTK